MRQQKNVLSATVGAVAAIAFLLSCGETGTDVQAADGGSSACSGECTVTGPVAVTGEVSVAGTVPVSIATTVPVSVEGTVPVSVAGAITVAQPVQVKTADTDATRLVGGTVDFVGTAGEKVADGPLVLTDLLALQTFEPSQLQAVNLYIDDSDPRDCHGFERSIALVVMGTGRATDMHGARLLVKAGAVLCGRHSTGTAPPVFSWSGFRPYE
jgi:hypothetical protein